MAETCWQPQRARGLQHEHGLAVELSLPSYAGANSALAYDISANGMRGVNDQGWTVGNDGGLYSNPVLYANGQTYLLSCLITNGAGWNFSTTTTAGALDIANNGSIIGIAQINGIEHMYMAMLVTAVSEPASCALLLGGLLAVGSVRCRRRALN